MKITGTRSSIKVELDDRFVVISGELTTTPAFYADLNSIKFWETSLGRIPISDEERTSLVREITKEGDRNNFPIYFE